LIVTAILLAWSNTWSAPFEFDDHASIIDNASIRQLWPATWRHPPATAGETVSGRPVLNFTFAVNYALGGLDVRGYHAVNLLIHTLAALTLFGILRRTLASDCRDLSARASATGNGMAVDSPARPLLTGNANVLALAIALLWALHPLQTESVTYIVQRAESLGGLWCLLTLYGFIRGATSPRELSGRWFILAIGSCLLGIGTKETVAVMPVICLLWDRTFASGSFAGAWRMRGRVHAVLFATWLPLAWLVLAGGGTRGGTFAFTPEGFWLYWLSQLKAVVVYLRLVFWPYPLVFDRAFFRLGLVGALPYACLILPLLFAAAWGVWRRTAAGFAAAAFFILLAPSSLMPGTLQVIVEHRMYLALAVPLGLLVTGLYARAPRGVTWATAAAAVGLGVATYGRNEAYRTEQALWADTAAKAPANPRAHYNHGLALAATGRTDEAAAEFTRTLELQPNHAFARFELGKAALLAGRWPEAARWFESVVQIDPQYVDARFNLGQALARQGRTEDAIAQYQQALEAQPGANDIQAALASAQRGRGQALAAQGDFPAAEAAYREALRLEDGSAAGWFALGNLLARQQRFAEAIAAYQAALTRDPAQLDARSNLANCLLFTGRLDEAISEYETVLQARPGDGRTRENLRLAREARAGRP
jgi:tetratricopeptide (TPR) repeat protein